MPVPTLKRRILALIEHAVSPSANENEARNAAIRVCTILKSHPNMLSDDEPDDTALAEPTPYQRTGRRSEVHPNARAFLEWQEFKRVHGIRLVKSPQYSLCIACGEGFQVGDPVLRQSDIGFTHPQCGEWWRDYDYSHVQLPQDDDIPF